MERITWIGPLRQRGPAGDAARGFVRGFAAQGVEVAALDAFGPASPALEASDELEGVLQGPVRIGGSTVVVQAPLSCFARVAGLFARGGARRSIAYVVVDVTELDATTCAALAECDEVWLPSTLQRELAASLGIARDTLRVVPVGVDAAMMRAPVHAHTARPRVVVDGDIAFVTALRSLASDIDVVLAPRQASAVERARIFASCDLAVSLSAGDPWWRFGLEALAAGIALVHGEDGAAAEFVDSANAICLDETTLLDASALVQALKTILQDRAALERRARAARAAVALEFTWERAAARVLRHENESWRLPEARLARVLCDLGLLTPREIVGAAKARIVVRTVTAVEGEWCVDLAGFLATHDARDDVTLVLWVDTALAERTAEVAAAAEREIERAARGANGPDVTLVVAPVDHVPSEFVSTPLGLEERDVERHAAVA